MIGNDIVDMKAAARESNWKRKGFLEKVFSISERNTINTSENKTQSVWLLWSMKEAAYKAHMRKHQLPRSLNWKIHNCVLLGGSVNEISGMVIIEKSIYYTLTSLSPQVIHTVAVDTYDAVYKKQIFQATMDFSKERLLVEIGQIIGAETTSISLNKTSSGIPFIGIENRTLPISFSISDHGEFSGFSISLMNS